MLWREMAEELVVWTPRGIRAFDEHGTEGVGDFGCCCLPDVDALGFSSERVWLDVSEE